MAASRERSVDISVIITAHSEQSLLYRCLRSVFVAIDKASSSGIGAEVVVVLDRADQSTKQVASRFPRPIRIIETDFGDVGPARNAGISNSQGAYIALTDGDDLFTADWLVQACQAASACERACIWHPEFTVVFDLDLLAVQHMPSADPGFDADDLLENCFWFSCAFGPRAIFTDHPFVSCPRGGGFGAEDWHWYCQVIAQGYDVRIVREQAFFVRRRLASRSSEDVAANYLLRPTKLFAPSGHQDARTLARSRPPRDTLRSKLQRAAHLVGMSADQLVAKSFSVRRAWQPKMLLRGMERASQLLGKGALPAAVRQQWKDLAAIEPRLANCDSPQGLTIKRGWPRSSLAVAYRKATSAIGPLAGLFVLASAKTTAEEIREFLKQCGDRFRGPTVVIAEKLGRSGLEQIADARIVDLSKFSGHLTLVQQRKLVARLCLQYAPSAVVNVGSAIGDETFVLYGQAIRQYTSLFALAQHENVAEIARYIDLLSGVFCNCEQVEQLMIETLGCDSSFILRI